MQGATTGERLFLVNKYVSIHAPYAGSDDYVLLKLKDITQFQSTPPMQGATKRDKLTGETSLVSIHAPYAGSDRND